MKLSSTVHTHTFIKYTFRVHIPTIIHIIANNKHTAFGQVNKHK